MCNAKMSLAIAKSSVARRPELKIEATRDQLLRYRIRRK